MRIESVTPVILGYRKSDPPMERSFALVRVVTSGGHVGWGEASTNWGHAYPTVFATLVRDVCAPGLIGREPRDVHGAVESLHTRLDGYLGWEGLTSQTIGALEMALWDVAGRALGAAVHELLGATAHPIPVYGTGTTMFEASPSWHAHYFDQALAAGIRTVKVRLGRGADDDIETVAAVRDHAGGHVGIGVDSYWFHDARSALALAHRLAELGVSFFEEPLPQYRTADLAWLSHRSPVPIAVGERVYSVHQYADLAERGAVGVFQPDASICGGISACLEVAALARRAGIRVMPHVGGPTAIGLSANLQWATAAGVDLMECDIDPHQPLVDTLAPDLALAAMTDGTLTAPAGPGLGIEIPDDLAERYPYRPGDTYADVFPDHERGAGPATGGAAAW